MWAAIAVLVLVGTFALVAGPARGMRSDIARQRDLIEAQIAVTKAQQRISQEMLDISRQQLKLAQQQQAKTDESLELQRQVLSVAQQTLEQARQINKKTPDATLRD